MSSTHLHTFNENGNIHLILNASNQSNPQAIFQNSSHVQKLWSGEYNVLTDSEFKQLNWKQNFTVDISNIKTRKTSHLISNPTPSSYNNTSNAASNIKPPLKSESKPLNHNIKQEQDSKSQKSSEKSKSGSITSLFERQTQSQLGKLKDKIKQESPKEKVKNSSSVPSSASSSAEVIFTNGDVKIKKSSLDVKYESKKRKRDNESKSRKRRKSSDSKASNQSGFILDEESDEDFEKEKKLEESMEDISPEELDMRSRLPTIYDDDEFYEQNEKEEIIEREGDEHFDEESTPERLKGKKQKKPIQKTTLDMMFSKQRKSPEKSSDNSEKSSTNEQLSSTMARVKYENKSPQKKKSKLDENSTTASSQKLKQESKKESKQESNQSKISKSPENKSFKKGSSPNVKASNKNFTGPTKKILISEKSLDEDGFEVTNNRWEEVPLEGEELEAYYAKQKETNELLESIQTATSKPKKGQKKLTSFFGKK